MILRGLSWILKMDSLLSLFKNSKRNKKYKKRRRKNSLSMTKGTFLILDLMFKIVKSIRLRPFPALRKLFQVRSSTGRHSCRG
jgi:hypothetical protein